MERQRILDFPIHEKKGHFYAVKRIDGKVHWIPLGGDLTNPTEKIVSYCKEKGIVRTGVRAVRTERQDTSQLEQKLEELERKIAEQNQKIDQLQKEMEQLKSIVTRQDKKEPQSNERSDSRNQLEKVQVILQAIREGHSKRKLDVKGKGKYAKQLEDGKKVGEEKLNEMYRNSLRLMKNNNAK
jgi:TolA-binding protein